MYKGQIVRSRSEFALELERDGYAFLGVDEQVPTL